MTGPNPMETGRQDPRPHAVVIGAGFGGLAAAVRLGARGYRVTVLERNDRPGGKAGVLEDGGHVFDAGPTVVTAPHLFEELWELAGRRMADDIDLRKVDPLYEVRFHDGTVFRFSDDHQAMRDEVGRHSPRDVGGYERFTRLAERVFQLGFEQLVDVPFATWGSMVRIVPAMIRLQSFRTVYGMVARFVRHPKIRQVLTFHTLLVGGNPYSTTSIYCLINRVEQKWGVHFPVGGTGALVRGLVGLIEGQGNRVRLDADVDRITLDGRRATGVRLGSGEEIPADLVVSNADSAWTYRHLLPEQARRRWTNRRIERKKYSMGCFLWYFGTRDRNPRVAHHTILLGPRYRGLLDDIFERKVLADDFSLYLHRPTATDPSLAPAGADTFYALSPVPNLKADVDWKQRAEPYRRAICNYLEQTVLPGLSDRLTVSHLATPEDFLVRTRSFHGAAFGLQPVLTQSAYFRPHNRSEDIENLFLVGAGTHPGAGLPGVVASAKVLDRLIPPVNGSCLVPSHAPAELVRSARDDLLACRRILREGSKSFAAAGRLLPHRIRLPVAAMYAFCRVADDAVDRSDDPAAALDGLRARLERIYADRPDDDPVDRAFCRVVHGFGIPRAVPQALLEGFDYDAGMRRYRNIEDLEGYCARVASTVGIMMTLLMDRRAPQTLARACDLGLAMQLTNIARDVGEDAAAGRLYLPCEWMQEAGCDPDAFLERPSFSPALGGVIERLLEHAGALYRQADTGIRELPRDCRLSIRAARLIYEDIGRVIRNNGCDSVSQRAWTSKTRKLWLVLRAGTARFWRSRDNPLPPRPATRFLVESVAESSRSGAGGW